MTYAFIDAAVIALRLKSAQVLQGQRMVQKQNKLKVLALTYSPWTFLILSFVMSLFISTEKYVALRDILIFLVVINFITL